MSYRTLILSARLRRQIDCAWHIANALLTTVAALIMWFVWRHSGAEWWAKTELVSTLRPALALLPCSLAAFSWASAGLSGVQEGQREFGNPILQNRKLRPSDSSEITELVNGRPEPQVSLFWSHALY